MVCAYCEVLGTDGVFMSGGLTDGQRQSRSVDPAMPHVVNIRREYQEMKFSRYTGAIVGIVQAFDTVTREKEMMILRLSDPVEGWYVIPHNLN